MLSERPRRLVFALFAAVLASGCGGSDSSPTDPDPDPTPTPAVTGINPSQGVLAGGYTVTITGSNFVAVPTVTFGGTAATNVAFSSSSSITATVPARAAGTVGVVVTNSGGQSATLANGFTYVAAPTVTSVTPDVDGLGGNSSITITGTGFIAGATVTLGGTSATAVTVTSPTTITATTPARAAGTVDLVVTNPDGQTGTLAGGFTYVSGPAVTSITPNEGSVAGGYSVTITGANFAAVPSVTFGGTAATSVAFASSTSLVVTVPARSAGTVDVTVTNPDTQSGTLSNGFTFVPPPTIASVTPNSGSFNGGAEVVIAGSNFVNGATVTFGGEQAGAIEFESATELLVVVPAHAAGAVDVVVTNPDAQSDTLTNGFTYLAPTQLTSTDWRIDLAYTGGSFGPLNVIFSQDGEVLSGTSRDNDQELDVQTSGRIIGSQAVITFTLSNGGSSRGAFTCMGTISNGPPQTINGTFTAPETGVIGALSGTCTMTQNPT